MLGLCLRILIAVAATAAVASLVIYISGSITRSKLRDKLSENNVKSALIKAIDYCDNVVKLKDLSNGNEIKVRGDDVSYELNEGEKIYV